MNLTQNTSIDSLTTSDDTNTMLESNTNTDTLSPTSINNSSTSASVNLLNQLPEAGLGLNNIINIILIVIGVLLILLGIAILIRLKQ